MKIDMTPEEEFFYKQNRDLIDKKRAELDAQRAEQAKAERKATHWMKCPKCGEDMQERDMVGIKIDQCGGCQGVFFDFGELDLLLATKEQQGFLGRLKRALR